MNAPAGTAPAATGDAAPDARGPRPPLLVAWDGSAPATAAARVARQLAERTGAPVHLLHAVDTRRAAMPAPLDLGVALADELVGPGVHDEQVQEVQAAVGAAVGHGRPVDWPVRVTLGAPAAAVLREAARIGAGLTVLGLRKRGAVARALLDETVVTVMRAAAGPVLAVPAEADAAPQRAVVGVDFSRASLRAAATALAWLGEGTALRLVHVPGPRLYGPDDGERTVHELGVAAAFAWFVEALRAPAGVRVEHTALWDAPLGPVATPLLAEAERWGADLVVVANRRYGRVERWVLGSTTADVVRDGRVAVLAVPPGAEGA